MTATVVYNGELRTTDTHARSGTVIETDAPVDNKGKGERFSPTDLVATALASCILTTMGIAADVHGIRIDGSNCTVEKIMAVEPRRIKEIKIVISMLGQDSYSEKEKSILEHTARTCPVAVSLHPDLFKNIEFVWSYTFTNS